MRRIAASRVLANKTITKKNTFSSSFHLIKQNAFMKSTAISSGCSLQIRNKAIDFSWDQQQKAKLEHTYLTIEQSKDAVNSLRNELEVNLKNDIETISKMSNTTQLNEKYIKLRLSLGRNSDKDEALLKEMDDLQLFLAKSCFGIEKLESVLEKIQVLAIYQLSQQKLQEEYESKASTMSISDFYPQSRISLFNIERELLKTFAVDIAKVEKRKKQFENNELSDEEKMKPYETWKDEITVEESEITNKLDKPEDWIIFRFLLNDLLYRFG
ncbi:hypothetical protein C9374_008423 [Naegleria lovaniensis]|uniref:Uncharacterized protein n=1 Tax=Naegleria lovaniensis TaxID=51637 RepID=A0AA88KG33_NAELO|nr:uncharacterized protein C9374_008423 [Naegleria lovaniensis]KAG2378280.1 hypothetical protein C9374_008423 [Naegleria lovaniensis]